MSIDEWIVMLESLGYTDDKPISITGETKYSYTTTFGQFKTEWNAYRIY